jgi:tetrahydromethanopterin S-methyltransferase subunit F
MPKKLKESRIRGTCEDCKKKNQLLTRYGSESGPMLCGDCYVTRLY